MPPNWAGNPDNWQLVEAPSFGRAVSICSTVEQIDVALHFIDYALSRNPLGFPLVPGFTSIHLAKTKVIVSSIDIIPAFRLWFRPEARDRIVHKLWIELTPIADLEF